MKRSPELAPLSRDHHHALEVALRLRRADEQSAADAIAHFGEFWRAAGQRHFEIEEAILLPALTADDPDWAEVRARILREHEEIRGRAESLLSAELVPPEAARELGEALNAHVRYEERHMFVLLEERLAHDELAAVGAAVVAAERG